MFLFDGVGQVAFPFVYLVAKVQNIFALSASELLRYYKKMRMCRGKLPFLPMETWRAACLFFAYRRYFCIFRLKIYKYRRYLCKYRRYL